MGCGESSQAYDSTYTPVKTADRFDKFLGLQLLTKSDAITQPRTAQQRLRRKGRLTQQQIMNAYQKVQGNLQRFFDELSERISEYYMQLSAQGIESMTQHKLTQVETKVYLSQQFLLQTFDILRVIGMRLNFDYQLDMFKTFNKSQTVLINYIKQKYPRAGNIFVPGDLTQVFREFNMLENPQNDILRNAGICFMDPSDEAIIKKLKHFFNIIIDELDNKFPVFQNLLQQRLFTKIVDGKKISFNYKIGRKIPENTAKFQAQEGDELTITSPELFRMIIKWVGQLQQYFSSPQDEVDEKQTFKVYSLQKDQTFFDDITPDQFSSLNQLLKGKLKQVKITYTQSIHGLLKQMDMFNLNLLKILFTTDRKQKYVPRHEAQVIKFAMYNTKLVSWLLAQKLITVLKNLISVGISFEETEIAKRLDLIKFNVSDLLRAMVIGNRKQILVVYENLKKLQQEGQIKITKIKNRLGTPLNDVMVLFTFKGSFILCELQLILSDNQGVSEKVKNIQVLNHFLYELVRSPNGVLSEVAVLLGYKDNKINYEDKIRFENKSFTDFKSCQQKHPEFVQCYKVQKKPFICSNCTEFYHPFENIFGLKRCQKCFLYQCCRCMFKNNKQLQESQIHQRFIDQLSYLINDDRARKGNFNNLSKDITIQDVEKCFYNKKIFFKNIFKKNFQKLKTKDIQDYVKKCQFDIQGYQFAPSFIIVQFKGQNTFIKCFYWNSVRQQVQNSFGSSQNFYDIEKISLSNYDFMMIIKSKDLMEYKPQALQKTVKLCIKPEFQYQNVKKFWTIKIPTKNKSFDGLLVVRVELNQTQKIEGADQDEEEMNQKKEFLFSSIAQARKSLPRVELVLQNFVMKNCGVTTPLINEYFSKFPDRTKIKSINLSNNKITDAQIILNQCLNLQNLLLSKNFIKNLIFGKPLKNLIKLIVFENKLVQISGLINTPSLKKFNFQSNRLKTLQVLDLKNLNEFVISENQIQHLDWLQKSKLPTLENLSIVSCGFVTTQQNKSYKFSFPKLKKIIYEGNPTNQLHFECPQLRFIHCVNNQLNKLTFSSHQIEYLDIQTNNIENLQALLIENNHKIKKFYGSQAGNLQVLPKLAFENLQNLNISSCSLKDISNLQTSNIPKLIELNISYNLFVKIPTLNFPNLKNLYLSNITLEEIHKFSESELPLLQQLEISGKKQVCQIPQCPLFKFPSLKSLKFQQFSFVKMDSFSQSLLPNLQRLELYSSKFIMFPKLSFEKLKQLILNYSTIEDFSLFNQSLFSSLQQLTISSLDMGYSQNENLAQSKKIQKVKDFPKLKNISIYDCKSKNLNCDVLLKGNIPNLTSLTIQYSYINVLPVLNLPQLTNLVITSCQLTDINNLAASKLNKLTQITFQSNQIGQLPRLDLPALKTLTLSGNILKDVSALNKSNLPNIENVSLDRNQLTQFPLLKLPNLKQFSIADNLLKNFKKLDHCQMGNLQFLSISNCNDLVDTQFPILDLPKVTSITLNNSKITSLNNLGKSKLPKLQTLQLTGLCITSLPILKLPKLTHFNYSGNYYDSSDSQNKLTDISNIKFWQCPQLQFLGIKYSGVTVLPYMNLPKLQKIQMEYNDLTNISTLKTSFLPELCEVNFSNNFKLAEVPSFPTGCLIDLVNCSTCNLQVIPDMPELKVKNLYLNVSHIKKIGKMNLTETQYLNIQSNQIEDITMFLKQTIKLQHLYISFNQIKVFPEIDFPHLNTLNANDNLITAISLKQKNFPSLSNVNLQNNRIQTIAQVSAPLLSSLYLGNNKLTVVNFFKKENEYNLSDLKLQKNQISKIEYLPKVTYLYLHENKLKNLGWITNTLEKCLHFYFNENQIQDVSGLFANKNANFVELYTLNLSNNKIKSINFVNQFPSLNEFYLSNNQIQGIDNIPINLFPELHTFNISENKLKKFGPNISFKRLSTLSMQVNPELQQIKGMNCPNLYSLTLTSCGIKNTKWLQSLKLPELDSLYLDNNSISKLPKVDNMPKLTHLNISVNPIQSVDDIISSKNLKNITYIGYNIKDSLPLDIKKKIKQKLLNANSNAQCFNSQLYDQEQIQQQQQAKTNLQVKLTPQPLTLDEDGNVIIENGEETKISKKE